MKYYKKPRMDTVGFLASLPTGRNKFPYAEMRKPAGETG